MLTANAVSTEDLDDLFDEYDALTNDVQGSRHEFFESNLKRWFGFLDQTYPFARTVLQLENLVDFDSWYKQCLSTMQSMVGSATLVWPPQPRKQLGLKLLLCRRFSDGQIHPTDFCTNFMYSSGRYDDMVSDIVSQIFSPTASELRRLLRREAKQSNVPSPVVDVPASDRIVRLDHNSPAFSETVEALEKVEQAVNAANDYEDAEDKERRVAELSAGRRLLQSTRVRIGAVMTVLSPVLAWLAEKFAGGIIGKIADLAWKLLTALFGSL